MNHTDHMLLALQLAERGRYTVSPNPMVGCVIVKDGRIIGTGFHQKAGGPHAEMIALQQAGSEAKNATLYVTLEPCCHHGRTPPCTQALIQAGIQKVYVACTDLNSLMSGKGIEILRAAGITVECGLYECEARQLNEIFFYYIRHQRPFVFAKWAMSLDGKTMTHPNDSRDISCMKSKKDSHHFRQQVDAILIGSRTAIQDNPLLTIRHSENPYFKQPLRIILSSNCGVPSHLKLFDEMLPGKTLVMTTSQASKKQIQSLQEKNIEVVILPASKKNLVDLPAMLDELGKREITSLLVEGGMTVLQHFFSEKLVNKVKVYISPIIIASLENKKTVFNVNMKNIDQDFLFTADCSEVDDV